MENKVFTAKHQHVSTAVTSQRCQHAYKLLSLCSILYIFHQAQSYQSFKRLYVSRCSEGVLYFPQSFCQRWEKHGSKEPEMWNNISTFCLLERRGNAGQWASLWEKKRLACTSLRPTESVTYNVTQSKKPHSALCSYSRHSLFDM